MWPWLISVGWTAPLEGLWIVTHRITRGAEPTTTVAEDCETDRLAARFSADTLDLTRTRLCDTGSVGRALSEVGLRVSLRWLSDTVVTIPYLRVDGDAAWLDERSRQDPGALPAAVVRDAPGSTIEVRGGNWVLDGPRPNVSGVLTARLIAPNGETWVLRPAVASSAAPSMP